MLFTSFAWGSSGSTEAWLSEMVLVALVVYSSFQSLEFCARWSHLRNFLPVSANSWSPEEVLLLSSFEDEFVSPIEALALRYVLAIPFLGHSMHFVLHKYSHLLPKAFISSAFVPNDSIHNRMKHFDFLLLQFSKSFGLLHIYILSSISSCSLASLIFCLFQEVAMHSLKVDFPCSILILSSIFSCLCLNLNFVIHWFSAILCWWLPDIFCPYGGVVRGHLGCNLWERVCFSRFSLQPRRASPSSWNIVAWLEWYESKTCAQLHREHYRISPVGSAGLDSSSVRWPTPWIWWTTAQAYFNFVKNLIAVAFLGQLELDRHRCQLTSASISPVFRGLFHVWISLYFQFFIMNQILKIK